MTTTLILILILAALALLAIGAGLWTLAEYLMHRFAMHALRGKGMASREHLRHHALQDSVLESWWFAWAGVLGVGVALGKNASEALGPIGVCLGLGWVAGYGFYDWIHYRAHRRRVAHPYERWVRRHHFHHHFGHPMANHGVTTPVWDMAFGTYERVDGAVAVPRRLAMRWLCDDAGEIRAEYAGDYRLVGTRPWNDAQADEDRRRAFANQAPVV